MTKREMVENDLLYADAMGLVHPPYSAEFVRALIREMKTEISTGEHRAKTLELASGMSYEEAAKAMNKLCDDLEKYDSPIHGKQEGGK